MSVTASEDLLVGSKLRANRDGYWNTRIIFVTGLDPTAAPNTFGGTYPNENPGGPDVTVPNWAYPHPTLIGTGCLEVEQFPWPETSRTSVKIVATYGPIELINGWKITVVGSNGTKTLTTDQNGNPLVVKYTPPPFPGPGITTVDAHGNPISIAPQAPIQQSNYVGLPYLAPGSVVTFEHEEYNIPAAFAASKTYKSTTNSATFLGYAKHNVVCRDIQLETRAGGTRVGVRYIFDIDPSPFGWQQNILFRDPFTGQVPSDVKTSTNNDKGILTIDPYATAVGSMDFNALNLPTAYLGY